MYKYYMKRHTFLDLGRPICAAAVNGVMRELRRLRYAGFTLLFVGFLFLLGYGVLDQPLFELKLMKLTNNAEQRHSPIIFVGGVSRSGTTLMRVLLDVHPWIRCGPEGMVIKPVLDFRHSMPRFHINWSRQAGIYPNLLDSAISKYIRYIVEEMGPPANILCYKRPEVLLYTEYLATLFPDSKFIIMLRDGRAVAVSNKRFKRNTTEKLHKVLNRWMLENINLTRACQSVGPKRCLIVRYELLILNPERELRLVTNFLDIPWDPVMLHHEEFLKNRPSINPYEPSTSQVKEKINNEALARWFKDTDNDTKVFIREAPERCFLLKAFGFLNIGEPPDYSKLPRNLPDVSGFKPPKEPKVPKSLGKRP
ncbi:Protein-tyrosine sulfotransferase 1 [Clonorchis sinensis]|uniref:Protein-tyrosine sulfotransferase 1 n=2 Tax=Clonorchis sinensis TaxID=79923 RepID=A0A8T1N3C9_CLOSI|nr:Protein-tyrosine sulfotransferase 1 [Clonorchis sinensis]GAA48834.1 protein-tyrosine sulfotransferase [Clonorchis sinensis]